MSKRYCTLAKPQHQFVDNELGLDRLSQPDIIGDQKIHPRHLELSNAGVN
jgi:hypothetical protein